MRVVSNEPMVWCLYTYTNELNYYGFIVKDLYVCIQMKITYPANTSNNNSPVQIKQNLTHPKTQNKNNQ